MSQPCIDLPRRDGHDLVLVLAEEPMRDQLVALVRRSGYHAQACTTPLETVQVLEHKSDRLRCALISPQLAWGHSVGELLDDEYPGIDHVVVGR
jgi:hypothetical protein